MHGCPNTSKSAGRPGNATRMLVKYGFVKIVTQLNRKLKCKGNDVAMRCEQAGGASVFDYKK